MRRRAFAGAVLALVALATLVPAGCRHEPESPTGDTPPAPEVTPSPDAGSDITWVVRVPAVGATSPGVYDLATPATLTIEFSGPVDRASVATALTDNFARTSSDLGSLEVVWTEGWTATLEVGDMPSRADLWVEISPVGGSDANGKPPKGTADSSFIFRPGRPLTLWRYRPGQPERPPESAAALDQPYTVVSLAPTGDRMLLWVPAATHEGVPGPLCPSRYYLLDLAQAEFVALGQEDAWCPYRWVPDGTLCHGCLLLSPSPGGSAPAWLYTAPAVSGPGGQDVRSVQGLEEGVADRLFLLHRWLQGRPCP